MCKCGRQVHYLLGRGNILRFLPIFGWQLRVVSYIRLLKPNTIQRKPLFREGKEMALGRERTVHTLEGFVCFKKRVLEFLRFFFFFLKAADTRMSDVVCADGSYSTMFQRTLCVKGFLEFLNH